MKTLFLVTLFFTYNLIAKDFFHKVDIDEKDTINDVILLSGKKGDNRYYQGTLVKVFDRDIESLKKAINSFDQRCNDEYKEKRKYSDKKKDCKYFNGNVIENIIHKELKSYKKNENEVERFLISRRIYNREEFSQTDLVIVYKTEEEGKEVQTIFMEMIDKKEAKKYIDPLVDTESAFNRAHGTFKLTALSPKQTKLEYTYSSRTDHWLINKSIAAGEVFESMAKSLNNLFKHLDKESQVLMASYQAQQGK